VRKTGGREDLPAPQQGQTPSVGGRDNGVGGREDAQRGGGNEGPPAAQKAYGEFTRRLQKERD
jgi:hypothetical protein